jgi:hypothetical protein
MYGSRSALVGNGLALNVELKGEFTTTARSGCGVTWIPASLALIFTLVFLV